MWVAPEAFHSGKRRELSPLICLGWINGAQTMELLQSCSLSHAVLLKEVPTVAADVRLTLVANNSGGR